MTDAMQSSDFVKAKGSIPTTDREGKSVTTVVVMGVSGLVTQWIIRRRRKGGAEDE